MSDKEKPPRGGDRDGDSNVIPLFDQNSDDVRINPYNKQSLTPEEWIDLTAEAYLFLCTSSPTVQGNPNITTYLWRLARRALQEVLK